MSGEMQQASLVKESLFHFIGKNTPTANVQVIDDIVLSYVSSILEEASQDPCFDVDAFIEMMAAYIPEFATIHPGLICQWILELEAELGRDDSDSMSNNDDSAGSDDKSSVTLQSLSEMLPAVPTKNNRSHSNSESSESMDTPKPHLIDDDEHAEHCRALHDMFPNSGAMEIKHCVSIAAGDLERAAATLLHRRDYGQALSPPALGAAKAPVCDDDELKNRIIARYSYIDKNAEVKEHRPVAPKIEPKKLVRYRDNKIVSLKGERYTEVPKSGVDEENLKKPKKQHCP